MEENGFIEDFIFKNKSKSCGQKLIYFNIQQSWTYISTIFKLLQA